MRIMSALMSKPRPFLDIPSGGIDMQLIRPSRHEELDKVVVVMGATGTGKSRLSIDLATRFKRSEIINSDKMQMYKGLDITTNKITEEESKGVPHHLMSIIDPTADFTSSNFCNLATDITKSILRRGNLPIIAGGSNSFIESLIDGRDSSSRSFEFCFLWVDVSMPVLHSFVSDRVDRMVQRGMVKELAKFYTADCDYDYSRGIRRSIGVPEFDRYLRAINNPDEEMLDPEFLENLLEEAIKETKINTCKLACKQREKINRLRTVKRWKINRLDATQVFRRRGEEAEKAWENLVVGPSSMIVNQFLNNKTSSHNRVVNNNVYHHHHESTVVAIRGGGGGGRMRPAVAAAAAAAATH